jgi:hypothetical protein
MENTIHKGIVMDRINSYTYNVWMPTAGGAIPLAGVWQWLYKNTGSALFGDALEQAEDTAKPCMLATPLHSGAWFKALPEKNAAVFNNRYREGDPIHDYMLATDYVPPKSNDIPPITMNSDNPAITMSPFAPTLNVAGGMAVPTPGNIPPGTFVELEKGQHVLVVFPEGSRYGIIIASLPSKEEMEVMLGDKK